jgi:hypothetical protein
MAQGRKQPCRSARPAPVLSCITVLVVLVLLLALVVGNRT